MTYKDTVDMKNRAKLNRILESSPDFLKLYFTNREGRLSTITALSYAYNINVFLSFLHDNNSYFKSKEIKDITLQDLDNLETEDILEFTHWLRFHSTGDKEYSNKESTIDHYISAISKLYDHFIKLKRLSFNPVDAVEREKKKKKPIIRLDENEKCNLLKTVEYGTGLTQRQQLFHDKNALRDYAIVMLFLSTGMRVSELIGINVKDINFNKHCVHIYRKGGNEQEVFFSDSAEGTIREYLEVRHLYKPVDDNSDALFLNRDGLRLSVRSVQKLIKKYTYASGIQKITPHKLRSTFATDMLERTGDIALTAERLGHTGLGAVQHYADYMRTQKHAESRNIIE